MSQGRELTAEQIALALARQEKKSKKQQQTLGTTPISVLDSRPWLNIQASDASSHRVKILSWNLLAQCLIRRELFPTSDCLKVGQREPMIHEEILRQDADILCLQEVDRLDRLLPMLEKAGYNHHFASGPRKKHGCLVAYKRDLYTISSHRTVFYDDQNIPTANDSGPSCKGNSFMTRNIASLVALRHRNDTSSRGIIVATTHLFWHPRYTYERIRQLGIMLRESTAFREENDAGHWPCLLAGDFNFTPSDPAYSLLFRDTLLPPHEEAILTSRVIHASVDPTVLTDASAKAEDAEESDPDRVITNARQAKAEDGLLTAPELVQWFQSLPKLRSAYNDGLAEARKQEELPTYGGRNLVAPGRHGSNEPEYTSYTYYWKSVLDYIFFLDPLDKSGCVTGLLKPPTTEDLDPGIPKKRISGSDHTVMVAELSW